jgi:hypothetical protein
MEGFLYTTLRKAIAITPNMVDACSGKYILGTDTITINQSEGKVFLHVSNGENYRIYFYTEQDFFSPELPFDLKFEKDNTGKVTDIYFKNRQTEFKAMRLK